MCDKRVGIWTGFSMAVLAGAATLTVAGVDPSRALEPVANEKEALKACEQKICDMVVNKAASGDDLNCAISKTWAQTKIKEGIQKNKLTWGFGDARCSVNVSTKRDTVLAAITKPEHALEFGEHTIKCEVERDKEVTPINITLAPKVTFKSGKADKAWLNVKSIEAPAVIKASIWTVAQIEDNFGLFHGDMIAEINEFVHQKCPKAMGVAVKK